MFQRRGFAYVTKCLEKASAPQPFSRWKLGVTHLDVKIGNAKNNYGPDVLEANPPDLCVPHYCRELGLEIRWVQISGSRITA